jgi:hypothetical protein
MDQPLLVGFFFQGNGPDQRLRIPVFFRYFRDRKSFFQKQPDGLNNVRVVIILQHGFSVDSQSWNNPVDRNTQPAHQENFYLQVQGWANTRPISFFQNFFLARFIGDFFNLSCAQIPDAYFTRIFINLQE